MARHARTVVVTVLALGLMAFFLRNANLQRVWGELGSARPDLLAAAGVLAFASYLLRAERWRRLLRPVGRASFRATLRATVIGFAANTLLPGRLGELARPYVLARREHLSVAAVFATSVIERLLDLLVMCLVFSVLVTFVGPQASARSNDLLVALTTFALVAGLLAVAGFGIMLGAAADPERAGRGARRLLSRLPHGRMERLAGMVQRFLEAVAATRGRGPLGTALAWSFPIWASVAASLWCASRAFGIDVHLTGAAILMTLAVVGVAVPTPGGVGGYHAAYQLGATTLYGASAEQAVGAALVLHLLWFGPVTALGLVFMARDGMHLAGLRSLVRRDAATPAAAAAAGMAGVGAAPRPAGAEERRAS